MGKLIVCNIISLDGYYEGPEKNVMALPFDEAFDEYNAERLRAAGTLLLGRASFEGRSPVALRLLDSRTLENSELVLNRYSVRH